MADTTVREVICEVFSILVVLLDENMSFESHIKYVTKKNNLTYCAIMQLESRFN